MGVMSHKSRRMGQRKRATQRPRVRLKSSEGRSWLQKTTTSTTPPTGWALGERCGAADKSGDRAACDAASLYDKLENIVMPLFYRDRERFLDVMRHVIALNGSFFNTQRMVLQYVLNAYFE